MAIDAARAKSLFLAASDLADPAERAGYLERECGGDAELGARVDALLRANDAAPLPVAAEGTVDSAPALPETEDHGDPTARVGAVLAGKYKLVEEIGEGGMGSVFMAQQTEPVKRAVAVKVIKAGMDSKAVLARFEAERQALAMMDHPNIARVLDAGTTDGGRPFFVMELVKGTPITRYCDEHKLTPRQRLELFVPVCQAIQHAHQKGIIHRDIKPSNVLVALYDDRPVPKVIDFGVAKAAGQSLTDKTLLTGFGALVGTPEYMSPEQASLNNLDIDTRSDVYSLGVLLYELLTGTTPVDKKSLGQAALLEILRIVREVEAPRPSAKLSTLDALPSVAANRGTEPARLSRLMKGELDWLVLKALEKDRTRRYETANALNRDIQRYLADEVVEARPPSVGYRVSKFVRRHKGQVIAASLVLLALVGGIVGTTLGLFEARRQEEIARDETAEKELARAAEAQRVTERDAANKELVQANDKLVSVGARGLLRPLAGPGPLNAQEVESLWELAASTGDGLRLRFVELALSDALLTRRLKDRAPFAFQAGVGLDPTRRARVERMLAQRLEATAILPEEQQQVALCLVYLGGLHRRPAGKTADALVQAMRNTTDPGTLQSLARHLAAVSPRLEPKEAAQLCGQAATILNQTISKTTNRDALRGLVQSLLAVSGRLEPKEAAEVCSQAAATLTQAMSKNTDLLVLLYLARGLSPVSAHLEPKQAGEVAAILTQALCQNTSPQFQAEVAQVLSAVSARLEPKQAAELAAILTQAVCNTADSRWTESRAQAQLALVARLGPKEAAEVAATLTQAMSKTTDWRLRYLAQNVAAVSGRLEPKEAARVCGQAAATLIQAMSKNTNPVNLQALAQGLSAVSARLGPKEAAEAAANLTQAMSKTTDLRLGYLAQAVAAVSVGLEPKEAARVCGQAAATLIQAMRKDTNPHVLQPLAEGLFLQSLAEGLLAVSRRLDPKEAAQVRSQAAATLTQAMTKNANPYVLQFLGQGLLAVSVGLQPKQAAEVAAILARAMREDTDWRVSPGLAQVLSAVSAGLEPKQAAGVAAILIQAVSKFSLDAWTDLSVLPSRAQALSAVSACLEPKEAARVCGQAAATLIQAMSRTTNPRVLGSLAQTLSAVAARMEPKQAAEVAATIIQAMSKTTHPFELEPLAQSLSAVSVHLEPKQAAEVAATLTQAMDKAPDWRMRYLAQGVAAVSGRLGPKRAAEFAGTLTQAMGKTTDTDALRSLAEGLSAALSRELPPQTLVDLLKHPFCIGEARRLVLDRLARHYHRPFADQWDFVGYVQQQKLGLDLTMPPAHSMMLP
jgi:serine/threonine protein kinase